jgi:hypothetical protein
VKNLSLIVMGIGAALLFLIAVLLFLFLWREKTPYLALEKAEVLGLDVLRKYPQSPITRVQFYDALHSQSLTNEVEAHCRESLGRVLSGDGINVAVQSAMLSSDELTLVYKFSRGATALYETGRATIPIHHETGRHLAWMMDKQGIIIEQAKEASLLGARLASSWALLVSSAHIISGIDIVRRLEKIDRNVSELLAGRTIDHDSKLMRIYTQAASVLNEPITTGSVRQLVELRYDLYELRQVWRGEIKHLVKSAALPNRSGWHPTSWYRRENREKKAIESISDVADKLRNLRVALITGTCLAHASGTSQDFVLNELPNEHSFWKPLGQDVKQLVAIFRRGKTKAQVSSLFAAVEGYTAVLEGMTGRQSAQSSLQGAITLLSD